MFFKVEILNEPFLGVWKALLFKIDFFAVVTSPIILS